MSRIVVTLGPATEDPVILEQVVKAGADSFRFPAKRRGVALPGRSVPASGLTDKDRAALQTLPGSVFSAVIISFVESADGVREARDIMAASADGHDVPPLIAKVETRAGAAAVR